MELTQVQDFAFIVTDGSIQHINTMFGYETYEEAKKVLARKLASNWSIVEDQNAIQSFIKTNSAFVEELKKYESMGVQTQLKGLELLVKQHPLNESDLTTLLTNSNFSQRVYDHLENEVETDPYQFVNDGEVEISENDIDIAAESVFEGLFEEFGLEVNDGVYEFVKGLDVTNLVELVEEQIKDDKSFYDDPLGYYGMKQSDFI